MSTIKQCEYCKNDFTVYKSRLKKGKGHFCTLECYLLSVRREYKKSCELCKKVFAKNRNVSPKKFKSTRFCSIKCAGKYLDTYHKNNAPIGSNAFNWKGGVSKEKGRYYNMRRGREFLVGGKHSPDEWAALKKRFGYQCLCCGRKPPEIVLSRDHIVPITKGGSNNIENIQPLCKSCNSRKHDKTINYINKKNASI